MPPEPLFVNTRALRGHAMELDAALDEFPDPPAAFSAPGADAISVKIASLLPQIEGPILAGLPRVEAEARATAEGIVAAADTYQRKDEELADMIRGTELGSGQDAPAASSPGASNTVAAPAVSGSSAPSGGSSGMSATGGSDQMSQLAGLPMQVAGQAAQVPGQVMGLAAAVPQTMAQGAQQAARLAGGVGDDSGTGGSAAESADERPDEAAAEEPGGERAPVEEGLGGEPAQAEHVTEL